MGFFSSAWNSIKSAATAVGRAATAAWGAAKEVAGKAIEWMAEKAEHFVNDVKKAWAAVKPYVTVIRTTLQTAAAMVPVPWVRAALLALDKALGALTAFENSPIAKKIDAAIQWAIKMAKRLQESKKGKTETAGEQAATDELTDEELNLAKQHQETFRFAERESFTSTARYQLELAAALNDFQIAQTELAKTIDAAPADFEHYLRLRATQKLLDMADKKFRSAATIDDLSADDLFLVRIASDLIKPSPELSQEAAARLDRVLSERYGKKLAPFVFEEMIASWAKRAEVMENQWTANNRSYVKDNMLLKRLTLAQEIQGELAPEEAAQLEQLRKEVPAKKQELDALAEHQHDLERYVGAAEGFLQLLEKTPEQLEEEERDYLLDDGPRVGQILIDCAQHDTPFAALDDEARALVIDFANAFSTDSKNRMKDILEVTA
ncbi:hypothetical protein GPY61_30245 [Massilia sp. NEAU-DD11]|uniref:Uncharacterized protein n=1 Tax=Massilia cellulosiltytica TaxID=2683234 RepID=A0A7X3KB19_9BURK|nr:hypothetical protein [Telluria cellulosilytica]MVW64217.1 hypothetical protein [Telluria cellulosilytica]